MVEVITYNRGESVKINNTYVDINEENYDPLTIILKIYDPKGNVIETAAYGSSEMIKSDIGVYYYNYSIADDALTGSYIVKWIATTENFNDVSKDQFIVSDPEKKLYCKVENVWNRAGIDESVATRNEVIPLIEESMAEIDALMGRCFQYSTTVTQWFDTNRSDPEIKITSIYLTYKPIIDIISIKEYDTSGNLIITHEAADYWINKNTGRITLLSKQFTKQIHRVEVIYNYGSIEVPKNINSLCAVLSAIKLLIHQVGGTYDDITSYSTCGINMSVGEPYMNMSRSIEFLTKEANRLMSNIGRLRPSCIIL
jgi:hypothetical protein